MVQNQSEFVREFFDRQHEDDRYASLKGKTMALDAAAAECLVTFVRGDVLCVGGVWDFFRWTQRMRSVTVLDLSLAMLSSYCPEGATRVEGDLYEVDFPAESFDTVVFPLMLHHTPMGNWTTCTARIAEAFERAKRWLRPGGRVLIVEYCPHPALSPVQRCLLPLTRRFLAAFGQPLVVMYTRGFYERQLLKHFDVVKGERIEPAGFDYWTWYPIFMSIGWLRLPLALYPKLHVFHASLGRPAR